MSIPEKPDKVCRKCQGSDLEFERTPEIRHYGKWVCSGCKAFVSWSKHPRTSEEMLNRQRRIRELISTNIYEDQDQLHKLLSLYTVGTMNMIQSNLWSQYAA